VKEQTDEIFFDSQEGAPEMDKRGRPPDPDLEMRPAVQLEQLGHLIRRKRKDEGLTLEQAAQLSGVSSATLSRLERRAAGRDMPTPDIRTLGAVTGWLEVAVAGAGFTTAAETSAGVFPKSGTVPDVVEAHLRADRNLDPTNAALLARMFRAAYSEFAGDKLGGSDHLEHDRTRGIQKDEGE